MNFSCIRFGMFGLLLFEVKNGMYWYGSVVRKLHLYQQKTSNPKPLSVENYVDLGDNS